MCGIDPDITTIQLITFLVVLKPHHWHVNSFRSPVRARALFQNVITGRAALRDALSENLCACKCGKLPKVMTYLAFPERL